jgi:hypothetical protein
MSNFNSDFALNSGNIKKKEGAYPSYFNGQATAKNTFTKMIKTLLTDKSTYQFYPSSIDYSDTFVTVSFPYDSVTFPVVIVDNMPSNDLISNFQNHICDLFDDYGNAIGERAGGLLESNLTITVYAKYTQQRDELVDIINYGIFQGKRRALESQGITVMSVSTGSQGEEDFGQDKIYLISIEAKIYTHWYADILYESISDITVGIPISNPSIPNDQGPPEVLLPPIPIIHTPAPLVVDPGSMAAVLQAYPCCGACGGLLPHPNTGANVNSEYYKAAISGNNCSCGKH